MPRVLRKFKASAALAVAKSRADDPSLEWIKLPPYFNLFSLYELEILDNRKL